MSNLEVFEGIIIAGLTLIIVLMARYPGPRIMQRRKKFHPEEFKE